MIKESPKKLSAFFNAHKPWVWTFLVILLLVVVGKVSLIFLGPDNVVEEITELFVEQKTGIKIDLSPDSPEND